MNKEKTSPNNENTEREIKELQRQLAELSFLLALKKMEKDHPTLEKFAAEIDKAARFMRQKSEKISRLEQEYIGDISLGKTLKVFGRVVLIGTIGYGITLIFDWLLNNKKGRF